MNDKNEHEETIGEEAGWTPDQKMTLGLKSSRKPTRREVYGWWFRENKKVIIVGGVCFVVGVATAVIVMSRSRASIGNTEISYNGLFYKPTITNEVTTILERRGHPGNQIRWDQTGEVFASQERAATVSGVSPTSLSRHLKNGKPVKGQTFTNLGEAG